MDEVEKKKMEIEFANTEGIRSIAHHPSNEIISKFLPLIVFYTWVQSLPMYRQKGEEDGDSKGTV